MGAPCSGFFASGWLTPGGSGGGPASSVSLVPQAPDTSIDVQGGYDFLMGQCGQVTIIQDVNQLPAPIGGSIIISVQVYCCVDLAIPAGDFLTFTSTGSWLGGPGNGNVIFGDVAGGLIRGSPVIDRATIVNINVAGMDVEIAGPIGEPISLRRVNLSGTSAGTIGPSVFLTDIQNVALLGGSGLTFTGAHGLVAISRILMTSAAPGFTAFTFDSSVIIVTEIRAVEVDAATQVADQRVFALDTGLISGAPAVVIRNSTLSGPGAFFDVSGSNMDTDDQRVIVTGTRTVVDTVARGDAVFRDLAFPVNVAGAADAFAVIPHIGAGTGLGADPSQVRFDLIDALTKGPLIPTTPPARWSLRYIGPSTTEMEMVWRASVESGGGGTPSIQIQLEIDPAGLGAWVSIPSTIATKERTGGLQQFSGAGALDVVDPGAEFRLTHLTVGAVQDTDVSEYTILIKGPL